MAVLKKETTIGGIIVTEAVNPIGTIIIHADPYFDNPNYFICDGRSLSRTEYGELFDIIGTNFGGGNGSTTFLIPKLNDDRFIRGADLGNSSNPEALGVGTKQNWAIKAHSHIFTRRGDDNMNGYYYSLSAASKTRYTKTTGGASGAGPKMLPKHMPLTFYIRVK